jgi:acyl-CoA synthetase (AMP-forming)/AMP-acid ligase II
MVTVPEMLARNARMYPNDCALVELKAGGNRREITWKEFDQEANRVANALTGTGIKKGDRIIHWMMNSIDWLIVYFGILRAGAWIVPLNFRFTGQDLKHCADISEAKMMILGPEFIERVDLMRSQLSRVERYICVDGNAPGYMDSFQKVVSGYDGTRADIRISDEDN